MRKTSLEITVFLGKGGNLPAILQRTDSRKDAKIAQKGMDEKMKAGIAQTVNGLQG
jgi:hypothetical protein